jgi:L-fuconolactonase
MVVVDTHCHASPYWFAPVESLLDEMGRAGVDKAILVQIGGMYDNSYLIECARRFPGRFSLVAMVDTDSPDAPKRLEELRAEGVEGIRLGPTVRSPGSDPMAIWRQAAELGMVVSCQGSEVEAFASPELENVIKELPNLNIVIEHLGGGGQDTAPPHNAYRKVLSLAQYPNTYMKVPGLGELSERPMPFRHPFPFENIPPLIEMALEAFGAKRLMWGSDFPPVAGRREGYGNALRWPMERVHFKSEEDKALVFGETAATLFKLPS